MEKAIVTEARTDWRSEWFEFEDVVYLNAASIGPLPRVAVRAVQQALEWEKFPHKLPEGSHFRASMITIKPGGLTGKHATPSISDEFSIVFEGTAILKLQDGEQTLGRGDSVTIVAGTNRQWRNESDAITEILVISLGPHVAISS